MTPSEPELKAEDPLETATTTVKGLLEMTYAEATKFKDKTVSQAAKDWWELHYVKSFYFALTVKKKTKKDIESDMKTLTALAKALGRTARLFADKNPEISEEHAWMASHAVDCPILSSRAMGPEEIRAEWCN